MTKGVTAETDMPISNQPPKQTMRFNVDLENCCTLNFRFVDLSVMLIH